MTESKGLSFRLDPVLSERLQKMAETTHQTPESLVAAAVHQYLAINEWHLEASVKSALAQAGRGKPAAKTGLQPIEDFPIAG